MPRNRIGKCLKPVSKQIFEELFNSRARVKILKFFFRNESGVFDAPTIASRIQERGPVVRKEIKQLLKIGFLQKKKLKSIKR